jgi:hypothetical protein
MTASTLTVAGWSEWELTDCKEGELGSADSSERASRLHASRPSSTRALFGVSVSHAKDDSSSDHSVLPISQKVETDHMPSPPSPPNQQRRLSGKHYSTKCRICTVHKVVQQAYA